MIEAIVPDYIHNIANYLETTEANGLLLHSTDQPTPYSDFDFYLVFNRLKEKRQFVGNAKVHALNMSEVMPGRLIQYWTTSFGGVATLYEHSDGVVKVDINTETTRTIQKSYGILGSEVVFDRTGNLDSYLGRRKNNIIERNFYTPRAGLQDILEQYYGFNWNALSKIWKEDYRLVAFEMIPTYLGMIARLEHAANGQISTNYFDSSNSMRPETTSALDEVEIRPERDALIAVLQKLQVLFHDIGIEVAQKNQLTYPDEAENLFIEELRKLKG